jgi:hypothetical protein
MVEGGVVGGPGGSGAGRSIRWVGGVGCVGGVGGGWEGVLVFACLFSHVTLLRGFVCFASLHQQ